MKPLIRHLVFIITLALCGCMLGPDFHPPAPPPTQTYTLGAQPTTTGSASGAASEARSEENALGVQTFTTAEHAPQGWWLQFQSKELNRLVDEALQHSPTLDEARAKLINAREDYFAQRGATALPSIDAKLSASRQKVDITAIGIPNAPNVAPFTLYNASISVSYVLDVFGGNRRALEALEAEIDYQSYELQAARLTLAGNVVSTAIKRASLQQQIVLTQSLIEAQAHQLSIAERRYAAGGVSQLDVHAQLTLLAQTQALLPPLVTQRAHAEHQLAIYLGTPPSNADIQDMPLDSLHLPDTVPLTLPSTLARERPDIRAAEALLHQASANVGVATANLFPQFAISAGVGSERTRISDVLSGLNIWNVGANLTQPIFHGGELRAKKRASEAAYEAALASYRQTVLLALQEVADALRAVESDAHELQWRDTAAREAQVALDIARDQYAAGGVSQFGLLDTERQALQSALDRTRAQADRLADTAALFQALGASATPADAHPIAKRAERSAR